MSNILSEDFEGHKIDHFKVFLEVEEQTSIRKNVFEDGELSSSDSELFNDDDFDDLTFCPEATSEIELCSSDSFVAVSNVLLIEPEVNAFCLIPYSASDTDNEDHEIIEVKSTIKGKKRVRNEKNWKKKYKKEKKTKWKTVC